ncbi:MAG TPA: Gfo/Idh/MocA family oxidoreductase, partial [Actinomycetes bacterium]|nr:Gfo/Idh/MocA family oxidoreductase [Actinomycetes bacterium]
KLDRIGDAYRIPHRYTDLDALLDAGIGAAFVHAATSAHLPLVERLLDAGRHVYVDKPLDASYEGAERLVRLAQRRQRSLMVGFNRRYAPDYAALRGVPRDLIVMEKHRANLPAAPRSVVFDDFIHVVDTLRFLAPGPIQHTRVQVRVHDGLLHHVVLELAGDGFTALGVMHRLSGAASEQLHVMGNGGGRRVVDLAEVVGYGNGQGADLTVTRRGDWTPVARQRGIEQICVAFLDAVGSGDLLSAEDALATHAICEQIVTTAHG